jgi:tetratricopeptide (TPR) repeat protein
LEAATQTVTNELIDTTLAWYLNRQGRVTNALEWARRACALSTDYPVAPALLCSLSLQAGENEEAVRAGKMALRLKPQDGEVHFNVGLALARMNRHPDAALYLLNAVTLSPRRADAHYWLGMALWNLPGRRALARDQVAAALELSPQNAEWKAKLDRVA